MEPIENPQIPQPILPVQSVPVEPKKKSNLPLIAILIIAILLVGVGGVYAGMQLSKKQTPVVLPTAPPPNIRPTDAFPTSIPDENTNLKTYKNEKYGFEFKYPENFVVESSTNVDGMSVSVSNNGCPEKTIDQSCSTRISISFVLDTFRTTPEQVVPSTVYKNVTILGLVARRYELWNDFMLQQKEEAVTLFNNKILYKIQGSYGLDSVKEGKKTFDQILSTFRFTD